MSEHTNTLSTEAATDLRALVEIAQTAARAHMELAGLYQAVNARHFDDDGSDAFSAVYEACHSVIHGRDDDVDNLIALRDALACLDREVQR